MIGDNKNNMNPLPKANSGSMYQVVKQRTIVNATAPYKQQTRLFLFSSKTPNSNKKNASEFAIGTENVKSARHCTRTNPSNRDEYRNGRSWKMTSNPILVEFVIFESIYHGKQSDKKMAEDATNVNTAFRLIQIALGSSTSTTAHCLIQWFYQVL